MSQIPPYEPTGLALQIFKDRYAIDPEETFQHACMRVAQCVAAGERGTKGEEFAPRFYQILATNRFSPGGRIWRGAGRPRGGLLNCFVVGGHLDSREAWGDLLRKVVIISGTGGGVGMSFNSVRPRGSPIIGAGGQSSGSVSLMKMIDAVCNELRSGGGRRAATLFTLRYDHPDVIEFMDAKVSGHALTNANISVGIDSAFINAVKCGKNITFRWGGKALGEIAAIELWQKILANGLAIGDPGLLNLTLINDMSPISYLGPIEATNPCGEKPLLPDTSCDLGSIVLPTHVIDGAVDWHMLGETIILGVRFLDNVLDVNHYPLPEIDQASRNYRDIGLGIAGLHDMLLLLGMKYSSEEALVFIDKLMAFIKKRAYEASIFLAVEKGQFAMLDRQKHIKTKWAETSLSKGLRAKILEHGIRNSCLLTIPPNGTTSMLADCSGGLEPMFSPLFRRRYYQHEGKNSGGSINTVVMHPLLARFLREGKSTENFEGARQISPKQHLCVQAACQKHVDAAVSKTINVSADCRPDQLSQLLLDQIALLKGVTIYREGSRGEEPLEALPTEGAEQYLAQQNTTGQAEGCAHGTCEV